MKAPAPKPAGRRPVVLLSRSEAYAVRELVTVAPVTSRVRGIPSEVPLGRPDGLPKPCAANLDIVTTIPKRILTTRLAILSPAKLVAIDRALRFALGLAEPPLAGSRRCGDSARRASEASRAMGGWGDVRGARAGRRVWPPGWRGWPLRALGE